MSDNQDPIEMTSPPVPEPEPPARIDLDQKVSDGRRSVRRKRFAIGGTSAVVMLAAAAAVALVVSMSPDRPTGDISAAGDTDVADDTGITSAADEIDFDTAIAGYPFAEDDNDLARSGNSTDLGPAAREHFEGLVVESGLYDAVAEIQDTVPRLSFAGKQSPGNEGQVWLRSYEAGLYPYFGSNDYVLSIEAFLPGGWTAEPGPVTDQVFPQHLISDEAYYSDEPPEFTDELLDDGRRLLIADHGSNYDLAVVYPNGSALVVTWDVDLREFSFPMDLEVLADAALAMPEIEYDTSGLTPIDELWDVPTGWPFDWSWYEAADDAAASLAAANDVLRGTYQDASLHEGWEEEFGLTEQTSSDIRGSSMERIYRSSGALTTDSDDPGYFLTYYLPGGWLPGFGPDHDRSGNPYVMQCQTSLGDVCEEFELGEGTAVTKIAETAVDGEFSYEVTVFDPDGWAVTLEVDVEGSVDDFTTAEASELIELAESLPAPVYDPDAVPAIPGEYYDLY